MKRFGFTLAEVLITLGIIGVIAALTLPALVQDSGKTKVGPILSKFVYTFEDSCKQLMINEDVTDLKELGDLTEGSDLLELLSKYMIMTQLDDTDKAKYTYYTPDGSIGYSIGNAGKATNKAWLLKDGSIIFVDYSYNNTVGGLNKTGVYTEPIGRIYIDINGMSGNNRAGKEVFGFEADKSGLLVPIGSNAFRTLYPKYNKNCSIKSNDFEAGIACTGEIADNGWVSD